MSTGPLSVEEMPEIVDAPAGDLGASVPPGVAEAITEFDATVGRSAGETPSGFESGTPVPAETAALPDGRTVLVVQPDPSLASVLLLPADGHGLEMTRPATP